jgi:site-specific recombinase XerD
LKQEYIDECPDYLREFLTYIKVIKDRGDRTEEAYFLDIRCFLRYLKIQHGDEPKDSEWEKINVKNVPLEYLKSFTLMDAYNYMSWLKTERGNEAVTRARKTTALKEFYSYLYNKSKLLSSDPLSELEVPRVKKALPKFLTLEETQQLLRSIETKHTERDYCIITLFVNCGMRLSELVGMDLGDIDLEQRQIRLFGKGHKERMVYLNEACVEALQLYLAKRNTMEGLNPKEKAVFVTRRRKERISNRRVEQLVTGAMKAAGLKGFSTHKLRHTAATLMYQTGNVDILTLKQLLGHSSVGTTQIYTHLQEFQVRAAIEQNPLGTVTPEKARLDTTKRAAGENRGENNADSMDVEEAAGPMEAFEGAAKDGIRVDISSMTGDKETV